MSGRNHAAEHAVDRVDRDGIALTARPVPRRHPGHFLGGVAVLVLLVWIIALFSRSEIEWHQVLRYFWSPQLLEGVLGTLYLTISTMALGLVLGTLIAVARQSESVVLRTVSIAYVWLFRGVPALVQLLLWFNIALILPAINMGPLYNGPTNLLITPFVAAFLGLGLSEAAYMAEIVRGGILAVPPGQAEAAKAMGMTSRMTMRRIILPQAMPVIVPPTSNEVINMLKYTSLAFAVSYSELLSQAKRIYTSNFLVMEVLLSATLWYIILCTVCTLIQQRIERRLTTRRSVPYRIAAPVAG